MIQDKKNTVSWNTTAIFLVVIALMFVFFITNVYFGRSSKAIPQPGSSIFLRGRQIILLRMAFKAPHEAIQFSDDGEVIRFTYPEVPNEYTSITLNPTELADIMQYINKFCKRTPSPSYSKSTEPYYDLGVRCGINTKQAKIPIDMLPEIFVIISDRVTVHEVAK